MRLPVLAACAVALVASVASRANAQPPTSLDVSAHGVSYYSDRYIVTADGGVRVRLSDGTILTGDTFSMDLKLNRFLLAGNVHLNGLHARYAGAACAGYPDLDRTYFLSASGTPDRWTFFGDDWTDTHAGREQPGDAFFFPDLSGQKPYIIAHGVTIIPKTNATFSEAGVRIGIGYAPTPRYVVTFSANSHFLENGFFGARGDISLPFNGSAHSITALHLRNDAVNGTYLALDQHFVWDRDWIVMSINPLTQEERQYNLIGYKRWSPGFESRLFGQVSEGQPGGPIGTPISASSYGNLQLNFGLRRSGLGFNFDQYNWTLLGIQNLQFDMQYFKLQLEHPMDLSVGWTGYENRLGRTPLLFRLRSGVGYAHDQWGEGGYLGEPAPENIWWHYAGGTIYTPSYKLGKFYTLTASFDKQRTTFSLPHHVDQSTFSSSISRQFGHLSSYLAWQSTTTGDYWGSRQTEVYPPIQNCVYSGGYGWFCGLGAWSGFGTTRAASLGLTYTPTPYFTWSVGLSHHRDTPNPVPGFWGQPPWQFGTDIRFRVARQWGLDFTRAYYFNFANERWTPQWGVSVTP